MLRDWKGFRKEGLLQALQSGLGYNFGLKCDTFGFKTFLFFIFFGLQFRVKFRHSGYLFRSIVCKDPTDGWRRVWQIYARAGVWNEELLSSPHRESYYELLSIPHWRCRVVSNRMESLWYLFWLIRSKGPLLPQTKESDWCGGMLRSSWRWTLTCTPNCHNLTKDST